MPSSRGSSDPGIEPESPSAPVLQLASLLLSHWGSLNCILIDFLKQCKFYPELGWDCLKDPQQGADVVGFGFGRSFCLQ